MLYGYGDFKSYAMFLNTEFKFWYFSGTSTSSFFPKQVKIKTTEIKEIQNRIKKQETENEERGTKKGAKTKTAFAKL